MFGESCLIPLGIFLFDHIYGWAVALWREWRKWTVSCWTAAACSRGWVAPASLVSDVGVHFNWQVLKTVLERLTVGVNCLQWTRQSGEYSIYFFLWVLNIYTDSELMHMKGLCLHIYFILWQLESLWKANYTENKQIFITFTFRKDERLGLAKRRDPEFFFFLVIYLFI